MLDITSKVATIYKALESKNLTTMISKVSKVVSEFGSNHKVALLGTTIVSSLGLLAYSSIKVEAPTFDRPCLTSINPEISVDEFNELNYDKFQKKCNQKQDELDHQDEEEEDEGKELEERLLDLKEQDDYGNQEDICGVEREIVDENLVKFDLRANVNHTEVSNFKMQDVEIFKHPYLHTVLMRYRYFQTLNKRQYKVIDQNLLQLLSRLDFSQNQRFQLHIQTVSRATLVLSPFLEDVFRHFHTTGSDQKPSVAEISYYFGRYVLPMVLHHLAEDESYQVNHDNMTATACEIILLFLRQTNRALPHIHLLNEISPYEIEVFKQFVDTHIEINHFVQIYKVLLGESVDLEISEHQLSIQIPLLHWFKCIDHLSLYLFRVPAESSSTLEKVSEL